MKDYRIAHLPRGRDPEEWSKRVLEMLYQGYDVQVPHAWSPWGVVEVIAAIRKAGYLEQINDRLKTHRSI